MSSSRKPRNPDFDLVKSVFEFQAVNIRREIVNLKEYTGHVCILVNVASKSGFTDYNYQILNKLYDLYADSKGLRILAFPCNQFDNEEPGSSAEIAAFHEARGVHFDVFRKIDVNGARAHPIWKFLKNAVKSEGASLITSSFTKFIVGRNGVPVYRFGPDASLKALCEALDFFFG